MNQMLTADKRNPRKCRKIIVALLLALLAAAVSAYFAAGRLLNTERLRSGIESRLSETVGLPARIDTLGMSLFPTPGVTLYGVHLGHADVYLYADVCNVFFDLRRLMRRETRVTEALACDVVLVLPDAPLLAVDRLDALLDTMREHHGQRRERPPPRIHIEIDSVAALQARVMLGDLVIAVGEARIENVTAPQIDATVTATLPLLGDAARLTATAQFGRWKNRPMAVAGQAMLTFQKTFAPSRVLAPLDVVMDGRASFAGDSLDDIAFQIAGDAIITADTETARGLFAANAWWRRDTFIVNDLRWQSPGLALLADITFPVRESEPAMHIHEATLGLPLAQTALDWLSPPAMRLVATQDAAIVVTDLLMGLKLEPLPRLASGAVTVAGVSVSDANGQRLLDDLRLDAEAQEGRLFIRELAADKWKASGRIAPDIPAGSLAFELQASGEIDKTLLDVIAPALAQNVESVAGTLELSNITGAYDLKKHALLALRCDGALSQGRLSYRFSETTPPVLFDDIDAAFRYADTVAHIDKLRFGGSMLQGEAHLADGKTPRFDLSGAISLADVPLSALPPGLLVRNLEGRFEATCLAAILPGNTPPQIIVSGALRDAGMRIEMTAWRDSVSAMSGTLTFENNLAQFALDGSSERLGAWRGQGAYDRIAGSVAGEAHFDMGVAVGSLTPESTWRISAADIAAEAYGQTGMTFRVQLPQGAGETGSVELRRQNEPRLHFQGVLRQHDDGGLYLAERHLEATVPLPLAVKHFTPRREVAQQTTPPIETDGLLHMRYEQNAAQAPYLLTLDATSCAARLQPWLHKMPGVPLCATVQGGQQGMIIALLLDNQTISGTGDGAGNYQGRDIAVALDKLARLITPDITLSGEVILSFNLTASNPSPFSLQPSVQAQLRDAAITLAPDIAFGIVNGTATYSAGILQLQDMTAHGNGFDCRLNMTRDGDAWRATLEGAHADMNRLLDFNEALAKLRGLESPREIGMTMPDTTGMLQLRIGEVAYRRGAIRQATGTAQLTPEMITIEDFACRIGQGTATGRVRVQPEQKELSRNRAALYVNLRVDGADAAQAERLLFAQPRELAGRAWGTVEAQLPTGREGYRRMDGKFQLQLRDGSLGRLGFATRLTTLLRNMEIVRLRMPSLQDEGLTYDNATINIVMRNGLAQLNDCAANSPSYTVEAAGLVDFARMQTDVQIGISIFDAVTGLVERVPIIGPTATSALREATRIRLRATGHPFDIRWQPDMLP